MQYVAYIIIVIFYHIKNLCDNFATKPISCYFIILNLSVLSLALLRGQIHNYTCVKVYKVMPSFIATCRPD